MIRISNDNFIISEVPHESFYSKENDFILEVEDVNCVKYEITFYKYSVLKIVFEDVVDLSKFFSNDMQHDFCLNYIFEIENSSLIAQCKKRAFKNSTSFGNRIQYHHYVLFVGDDVFEIVAHSYEIKKVEE